MRYYPAFGVMLGCTLSARAGYPGYSRAMNAPWFVQDAVALHTFKNGGRSNWNGSGC